VLPEDDPEVDEPDPATILDGLKSMEVLTSMHERLWKLKGHACFLTSLKVRTMFMLHATLFVLHAALMCTKAPNLFCSSDLKIVIEQ
jgi:hypothetical protein